MTISNQNDVLSAVRLQGHRSGRPFKTFPYPSRRRHTMRRGTSLPAHSVASRDDVLSVAVTGHEVRAQQSARTVPPKPAPGPIKTPGVRCAAVIFLRDSSGKASRLLENEPKYDSSVRIELGKCQQRQLMFLFWGQNSGAVSTLAGDSTSASLVTAPVCQQHSAADAGEQRHGSADGPNVIP